MSKTLTLCLIAVLCLAFPVSVFAKIGVGVGSGKVEVQDKLRPGMIYKLPTLSVLNTGDEALEYEVAIAHHENQKELVPQENWFDFNPRTFNLQPGEGKQVEIVLSLPLRTEPGDYFAYLEAHPLKKDAGANTTIGVAAAAKLYFTVVPANALSGIYYKIISFWKVNQPWSTRAVIGLGIILIALIAKRFLKIQVGIKQ